MAWKKPRAVKIDEEDNVRLDQVKASVSLVFSPLFSFLCAQV